MMLSVLLALAGVFLALISLAFILQGTRRELRATRENSGKEAALLLLQEQLSHLREQIRVSLEGNAQSVGQQISQMGGNVSAHLGQVTAHLNERLRESADLIQQANRIVGERLDRTAKTVGELQGSLARLDEATRRMIEVGQDINSLQQILQPPKLRGGFGEMLLENLLAQILPRGHYALQHTFRGGSTVDAVIRIGQGIVPVDAKFPLENFRRIQEESGPEKRKAARKGFLRDVKKHVADITSKYILPDEGTFDFALMYIPAENVYYETIIKGENTNEEESLSDFALRHRVIPVSPSSFYAYLQAIVLGLKGLRVENNAREIMNHLSGLQEDVRRFRDGFSVLGRHLTNAGNKYAETDADLTRIEAKIEGLGGGETDSEQKNGQGPPAGRDAVDAREPLPASHQPRSAPSL